MKKIFTCLALCLSLSSAVAQETPAIEGLYGVKLGAKPERLQGQVCIASRGKVKEVCIEENAVAARM